MFAEGQLPQTMFVGYNNDSVYEALFHRAVTYGQTDGQCGPLGCIPPRDTLGLMSKQIRTPLAMLLFPVPVQTKAAVCCRKDNFLVIVSFGCRALKYALT